MVPHQVRYQASLVSHTEPYKPNLSCRILLKIPIDFLVLVTACLPLLLCAYDGILAYQCTVAYQCLPTCNGSADMPVSCLNVDACLTLHMSHFCPSSQAAVSACGFSVA